MLEQVNSFLNALFNGDIEKILLTLITIIVVILISYGRSFYKKLGEISAINSNFTEVIQQQKQLKEQAGRIEQELNKGTIAYQIKLNAYHEKQIQAITDVYTAVVTLHQLCRECATSMKDVEWDQFQKKYDEFLFTLEANRIWFSPNLYKEANNAAKTIGDSVASFLQVTKLQRSGSQLAGHAVEGILNVQEKFFYFVGKELDPLLTNLSNILADAVQVEKKVEKSD